VRVLIGICVIFALTGALCAQTPDDLLSTKVDEAVARLRQQQKIPGTSLAVVRDGKIIKVASYGLANVELNIPVKPETIFRAASLTKQFTATAVMLLVEEGKVGLDDSITKYFPEAPATWKPVTIRHLLSHTSGIRDVWGETENEAFTKGLIDTRHDYTEDELVRIYMKLPLDFQPGDKWDYCSTGYELLGFLIHRVTGMSYFDFLQQRVFKPLDMNATRLYDYVDVVPNLASGYALVNGELKHPAWIAPSLYALADGGLLTNVYDLAKWDAALYTETILKRGSLEQMWTPIKLNSGRTFPYGFGWQLSNANGHHVIWHTGGDDGFFVSISRYVDDRLTIILMNNLGEFHSDTLKIADAIASIYIPATSGANPVKDW